MFAGAKTVTTNAGGHKDFVLTSSQNLPAGDYVTATATRLDDGNPNGHLRAVGARGQQRRPLTALRR